MSVLLLAMACAKPAPRPEPLLITPALIAAMIQVESSGNPRAIGRRGEIGLMQILPATGRMLGYSRQELFDPQKNVEAGTLYLGAMLDQFGNIETALAAYNCGPAKHQRPKCRAYGRRVLRQMETL